MYVVLMVLPQVRRYIEYFLPFSSFFSFATSPSICTHALCYLSHLCLLLVLERPTSQMSYLEHFLKETSGTRHGSVDSVEGDIEDNRAPSITSSKSNLSELSIVSIS